VGIGWAQQLQRYVGTPRRQQQPISGDLLTVVSIDATVGNLPRLWGSPTNPPPVWNVNLWQITDASGNRVMANHNRWIDLVWGVRFAPDSTGWLEVWVDGVNVLPRTNHATMWSGDSGMYLKQGLYKSAASSYPGGRSVI
jgi:hypothetical protein